MVDLSICMVSLNCWTVLKNCLDSVRESDPSLSIEIILVDNKSEDGTAEKVAAEYPEVRLISNDVNVGFLKGTNQAIRESDGRVVLWLNPDTVVRPDSLRNLVDFLDDTERAGIVGPKVLNADGSFQPQCKRGLPTPAASLAYFSKLDRLFPHNKRLAQYLLRYLPEDEPNQVDAVSGCCLMVKRAVIDDIGLLDEDLKQWGEDIEYCVRAKQAGWQVWYYPCSTITHLKGSGGRHSMPYLASRDMHETMWLFYKKHFTDGTVRPASLAVKAGISISLAASLAGIWTKRNIVQRTSPAVRVAALAALIGAAAGVIALRRRSKRSP